MTNSELTIFSAFHKEYPVVHCDFITPIQVGQTFSSIDLGFISDANGDNIADKNKTFSEMTAIYWIWKNLDQINSKWIGICHYRRYFTLPQTRIKKKLLYNATRPDLSPIYIDELSNPLLEKLGSEELKTTLTTALSLGKVIVPRAVNLSVDSLSVEQNISIKTHYIYCHIREDWFLMRDAVVKLYPEYQASFDDFFEKETKMYGYNMFIADKQTFSNYCSWLFPILFELEKTVKPCEYQYQKRVFGFFAERLFNLFLHFNKTETVEFPIVFIE